MRVPLVPVYQPIFGGRRIAVDDLMAGSGMMAGVVTCLRVGMHSGGQKDDRDDRQNMFHFTLQRLSGQWSLRPQTAFERVRKKLKRAGRPVENYRKINSVPARLT